MLSEGGLVLLSRGLDYGWACYGELVLWVRVCGFVLRGWV